MIALGGLPWSTTHRITTIPTSSNLERRQCRPCNEPIGQTSVGEPDGSSHQVEITPEEGGGEAIAGRIEEHSPHLNEE